MKISLCKRIIFLFLFVAIMFLLMGCSSQDRIVGTWEHESGESIEFFKDGTIIITNQIISATGEYSIIEGNRLRIEMGGIWGIAGAQVYDYKISGNQLNFEGMTYIKKR